MSCPKNHFISIGDNFLWNAPISPLCWHLNWIAISKSFFLFVLMCDVCYAWLFISPGIACPRAMVLRTLSSFSSRAETRGAHIMLPTAAGVSFWPLPFLTPRQHTAGAVRCVAGEESSRTFLEVTVQVTRFKVQAYSHKSEPSPPVFEVRVRERPELNHFLTIGFFCKTSDWCCEFGVLISNFEQSLICALFISETLSIIQNDLLAQFNCNFYE